MEEKGHRSPKAKGGVPSVRRCGEVRPPQPTPIVPCVRQCGEVRSPQPSPVLPNLFQNAPSSGGRRPLSPIVPCVRRCGEVKPPQPPSLQRVEAAARHNRRARTIPLRLEIKEGVLEIPAGLLPTAATGPEPTMPIGDPAGLLPTAATGPEPTVEIKGGVPFVR